MFGRPELARTMLLQFHGKIRLRLRGCPGDFFHLPLLTSLGKSVISLSVHDTLRRVPNLTGFRGSPSASGTKRVPRRKPQRTAS